MLLPGFFMVASRKNIQVLALSGICLGQKSNLPTLARTYLEYLSKTIGFCKAMCYGVWGIGYV